MLDDVALTEIAARFTVDSAGRLDIWRERFGQDRPMLDAIRALVPVSSTVEVAPSESPENMPCIGMASSRIHSWDRGEGESCVVRVEQALARIETSRHLNAFTAVFADQALAQAQELDARLSRGENLGPFAGAIVIVKDLMGVRGARISAGTDAYISVPGDDSVVVERLRAAGGIIIGTANLHALAYGPFSTSSDFGPVRNPLNTAVVAGGSSGGCAAAIAAGLADIAVGTDTAGSIRMPAALCGVVGLKPTYDLVPTTGAQPLATGLDHIGPLARTVSDARAALNAMSGSHNKESIGNRHLNESLPLAGTTIGLLDSYVQDALTPPIQVAFEQAKKLLLGLGAHFKSIHLPTLEAAPGIMLGTLGPEAFQTFNDLLTHRAGLLPDDVRLRLEAGMFITAADYTHCQLLRQDLRLEMDNAFCEVDAIMTPTMAVTAPLLTEVDGILMEEGTVPFRGAMNVMTLPFNLTGHPALTFPFTFDERGAGIGMQLVGARYADSRLLALASVVEAHTGHFTGVAGT